MTIRCMRIACWISKATNTHSEYVILTAFARQKWLNERASMIRYTYNVCLLQRSLHICRQCSSTYAQKHVLPTTKICLPRLQPLTRGNTRCLVISAIMSQQAFVEREEKNDNMMV